MSAVIWLIICGFVIYAALHVLAAIWQFFKSTGKFIGKAVDVSTQNVVIAQVQVKGRIARRIGRAGQDGLEKINGTRKFLRHEKLSNLLSSLTNVAGTCHQSTLVPPDPLSTTETKS